MDIEELIRELQKRNNKHWAQIEKLEEFLPRF
jgi:hypothetical protein